MFASASDFAVASDWGRQARRGSRLADSGSSCPSVHDQTSLEEEQTAAKWPSTAAMASNLSS